MAEKAETEDREYRRYVTEIDLYEREFKSWESRGKKILRLYKDMDNVQGRKKRFNVLWSNVQTLLPALYARDPQPVAERRFKDADPVGRVASDVIERCLSYTVDCQRAGNIYRGCVTDRLLPGRGVMWHRYEPVIEGVQVTDNAESEDELVYEQVVPDYVYWEDFGHNIARTWEEVSIVWRKVYMGRAKLVKRFGKDGQTIPLDYTPKGLKDEKIGEDVKKACIYELWDKEKGVVVFLSRAFPRVIETTPDPLELTGMFPCQRPLFATLTTDSLQPVPDYALYQTQAQEIESLTSRIDGLQKALKVAGIYDSSAPALASLLNEGYENKMIPVDKWGAFAEKGGLDGAVDFLPIKEIGEVLIGLYEAREKSKQDLYEITGISDIIRGNSEPNETATAQQIKGRFAVLRISDSQADVQRFVRDSMRIMAEIICEHFALDTIKAMSGIKLLMAEEKQLIQAQMAQHQQAVQMAQQAQQPPPPPPVPESTSDLLRQPSWEDVHALMQDQVLREFRVDIETDSTIRTDEDADKQERAEFLGVAATYIDKAVQAMQVEPGLGPLLGELLMFGVRSHRAARSIEPIFEDAMRDMQKPKPPKPNPEVMKIEAEKELRTMEAQLDAQSEQSKQESQHQEEVARQQMEDARAQRELERTTELETYKANLEMQLMREKAQLEAQTKVQVAQIQSGSKVQEMETEDRIRWSERDYEAKQKQAEKQEQDDSRRYDEDRRKSRDAQLEAARELLGALDKMRAVH